MNKVISAIACLLLISATANATEPMKKSDHNQVADELLQEQSADELMNDSIKPDNKTKKSSNTKNYIINAAPLLLLIGVPHADLDFKQGESWSIGPGILYYSDSETVDGLSVNFKLYAVGARVIKYFSGKMMKDGFFAGLDLYAYKVSASAAIMGIKASASNLGVKPGARLGYQWMWDNFTMRFGAGYSLPAPIIDWTMGWSF